MNAADILIVIVLALVLFFALRHIRRRRKKGCSGRCSECGSACSSPRTE
ncbi:MAG: FeoB-associated Cys-rich membrane protein [Clostridia bacterium]|nr:FeoB-associated Cys-rich membrane protein [Clostridia bacterium]